MDETSKDYCRLCAKRNEFLKDLMLDKNSQQLDMIQNLLNICIKKTDILPKQICLNCEEELLSFRLFILECHKAQDVLSAIFSVESETKNNNIDINGIKLEVKAELNASDLDSTETYDVPLLALNENNDNDDGFEDEDYIPIAPLLKKERKKRKKHKIESKEQSEKINEVLKQSKLGLKDFVKLKCNICDEAMKTWSGLRAHYFRQHRRKPEVVCVCGTSIRSKSVLYKHVSDHKIQSKKMRKANGDEDEDNEEEKYANLNVKDFIKFMCSVCQRECTSWYSLKSHCDKVHQIQTTVTCVCGITLKSKSVLYKHIQDHKNPEAFSCDKCPHITKTLVALEKHKLRHIPKDERQFSCSSCDKVFKLKEALKSHERCHIPLEERKQYDCDFCNLKFTTRSSAAYHRRVVHEKIKAYVCDVCGYACGTSGELRQHRAIHSDDRPFVCNKCSKPFKTYSNLKTHMDTHEDTSYACYVCSRILNSRRTLRKHLLVHEDKCKHVCSYCNKAFKRRQTLKVHMYMHTGDKPLSCKWCEERFAYASTLRSHRLRCHPDKPPAQHCGPRHPFPQPRAPHARAPHSTALVLAQGASQAYTRSTQELIKIDPSESEDKGEMPPLYVVVQN